MSRRVQWSDLHSELLHVIFQKLKDPFDINRCRTVCVSWKSVATTILSSSPPYLLFLNVLPSISCPLFNIERTETHEIIIPELEGRRISSYSFGWLLTTGFNEPCVRLLNPITRDQVELPPVKQLKKSKELRVITSTSPLNRNCLVLATLPTHNGRSELALCRPGDIIWKKIKFLRRNFTSFGLKTIFYQEKFYAVDFDANLYRIFCNIPRAKKLCVRPTDHLPGTRRYYNFLVELGGDLLMVVRFFSLERFPFLFRVYKLNWDEKRWIKMESIGSNAILLDNSSSISLRAGGSTYFKANCIYFLEHTCPHHKKEHNISFYNLETEKIECLDRSSFISQIYRNKLIWFIAKL